MTRTRVVWQCEHQERDGEAVGSVWEFTFGEPEEPVISVEWDTRVRRSEAARYADKHGYEFAVDEERRTRRTEGRTR